MPKITVIVPIYNVEKYLRKCFDSLLKQDYEDFVVMAVNDGSPDNSQEIIDEYTAKYPEKIKGVKKENGGYGSVLQLAIATCGTPYFLVCDPDDYLADGALSHLADLAAVSGADITIGAKYFIYDGLDQQDYDPAYNTNYCTLKKNNVYNKGAEDFKDLFFVDPSPHSKLYRTEVAKNIKFPFKVSYTDNLLFYISLLNSEKVIYTDKACAYYLVDRPGNTMTDLRPKAIIGHIEVFKTILNQAPAEAISMFWYRMFESFKFIQRSCERLTDPADYKECLEKCYELVELLMPHKKEVMKEYRHYSEAKIIEQIRDRAILTRFISAPVYAGYVRKMVKRFNVL